MKYDEIKLGPKIQPSYVPIFAAAIIFPASVILWMLNYFLNLITNVPSDESVGLEEGEATPSRWFMAVAVSLSLILYGLHKKSLSTSGSLLAFIVGFFLTLSSYCFMASLLAFFLSSSKATKFRSNQKKKFEEDFKEGGQRNWIQVLCNGGMATELAILYLMDVGFGERPIDFAVAYRASWLGIGILGSLACANGDTWASELGTVVSVLSGQPRLITTLRKVPRGTNGGVTLGGLLFSFIGGLFVGLTYYLTLIFMLDSSILTRSIPQWPIIILGGIGGLLGSVIDSLIGAILQYSGIDSQGKVREIPGPHITHISGFCLFDNHSVNLISTVLTGFLLPQIATRYM